MRRFWEYPDSCVSLSRSSLPQALLTPSHRTCPSISVIRSGVPLGWQWNQKISGASTPSIRASGSYCLGCCRSRSAHVSVHLLQQVILSGERMMKKTRERNQSKCVEYKIKSINTFGYILHVYFKGLPFLYMVRIFITPIYNLVFAKVYALIFVILHHF